MLTRSTWDQGDLIGIRNNRMDLRSIPRVKHPAKTNTIKAPNLLEIRK